MSLRLKIFLPLTVIYVLLVGYLYALWMPEATRFQADAYHRMQQRELKTLGESLLPMVVAGQLGDIHDTLDALRRDNPGWVAIELRDSQGRQIYPLPGTPLAPASARLNDLPLRLDGQFAGALRVWISAEPLLESIHRAQANLLAALAIATLIALGILALGLELIVRRPLGRLAEAAHDLAAGRFDYPLPAAGRDEVGELVASFERMRREVQESQARLTRLNETLEQRVHEEVDKNREKDHLLIQQSRLAAMGEMVHNIAHQWRQPLNTLALVIRNLKDDYDYGSLTPETMAETSRRAQKLLQGMSTTIDDFREFFRPDREKMAFDVGKAVRDALFIMEASLKHYNVALDLDIPAGLMAEGFPSQFSQAVLNVLMNAKEALQERQVADGRIGVRVAREDGRVLVSVEDNGGGIPADILPKIFDPYFTTKDKGSGIGLYMTKMIIENNMAGQVAAGNADAGARLQLAIPALAAEPGHG